MFTSFFFNDTATTEIYTLSLHDALPIWSYAVTKIVAGIASGPISRTTSSPVMIGICTSRKTRSGRSRSEEHTSELQSRQYLVCRLLLEKKKYTPSSYLPDIRTPGGGLLV